jgi:hypothetical protein
MADESEIMQAMMFGINFGSGKKRTEDDSDKVKTKARKKAYHTGQHNSGAARHKAEIRQRVKNRPSQRKKK